jgi:hypothetical protein
MAPASSRRAADVAPSARRKIRPPSRTGSAESRRSWKETEARHAHVWEANEYTQSENDESIAEMMEDICHALERLGRRDHGRKREGRSAFLV